MNEISISSSAICDNHRPGLGQGHETELRVHRATALPIENCFLVIFLGAANAFVSSEWFCSYARNFIFGPELMSL